MVGTASALITVNGIGAIFWSAHIAALVDLFGIYMFFAILSAVHFGLGLFVLTRMYMREAVPADAQGPFIAVSDQGTAVAASLNPETAWRELNPELVATVGPRKEL